jgi:hypothetical protein
MPLDQQNFLLLHVADTTVRSIPDLILRMKQVTWSFKQRLHMIYNIISKFQTNFSSFSRQRLHVQYYCGQRRSTLRPVRGAAYEPHSCSESQRREANRRVVPMARMLTVQRKREKKPQQIDDNQHL